MKRLFELVRGKHDFASIQMSNECFFMSMKYHVLDVQEDEYHIFLGEKSDESFDFTIIKDKIDTVESVHNEMIKINLTDGNCFLINVESDCADNPIE